MKHAIWLAAASVLLGVAGCAAATPPVLARGQPRHPASHGPRPAYQMGIDLDFYWYKGMNVPQAFTADARYAKSLGANAVSIAFPLSRPRQHRRRRAVHPLARGTRAGDQRGQVSRASGVPAPAGQPGNPGFFPRPVAPGQPLPSGSAPTRRSCCPTRGSRSSTGVAGFYVGTELSQFAHSGNWAALDAAVGRVYHGPAVLLRELVRRRRPGAGG